MKHLGSTPLLAFPSDLVATELANHDSIGVVPQVLGVPRVPVGAHVSSSPSLVLSMSDNLQVFGVGTQAYSTQVVEFHAWGDRVALGFPDHPMNTSDGPTTIDPLTNDAVAVSIGHGTGPDPTPVVIENQSRTSSLVRSTHRSGHAAHLTC